MQIQTLTVSEQQIGTIVSAIDDHNNLFLKNLHSHQELEIVYIRRGSGHLVMGDSVQTINEGDIIVIGTNVPHLWLTSHEEMNGKDKSENDQTPHIKRAALARITATSVQFSPDFAGSSLWDIHEMLPIKQIVYSFSKRGIRLKGQLHDTVKQWITEMVSVSDSMKIIYLLRILAEISEMGEYELFMNNKDLQHEDERVQKIIAYLKENYSKKLKLDEIAKLVFLHKNSVCNYFHKHSNKTIFQVLHQIRIDKACYLLLHTDDPIESISSRIGYFSQALFNRKFKELRGTTPNSFRKKFTRKSM